MHMSLASGSGWYYCMYLPSLCRGCVAAGEGSLPGMLPYAHKMPLDLHHVPDEGMMAMQVRHVVCTGLNHT